MGGLGLRMRAYRKEERLEDFDERAAAAQGEGPMRRGQVATEAARSLVDRLDPPVSTSDSSSEDIWRS